MEDFAPGQRWAYRTRPGEEDSALVVLRREVLGGLPVLHLQLQGLRLRGPSGQLLTFLEHTPVSEEAVRRSVTRLLETGVIPEDGGGYEEWRAAFDRGEAGVFTVPVADLVDGLEEAIRASAPPPVDDLFRKSH